MKRKKIFAVLLAAGLTLLAWFSACIPFYTYPDPLDRASLQIDPEGEMLRFRYSNDAITLEKGEGATVYALTEEGMEEVPENTLESFPENWSGSLAAVGKAHFEDVDGDGRADVVVNAAKTDMEYTQEFNPGGNAFQDIRLPFEAVFEGRSSFRFLMHGEPLAETEITVVLENGFSCTLTTDENGVSTSLTLNQIRDGVTFLLQTGSGIWYRLHYQTEDNSILTGRWLSALMPFTVILFVTLVCITADVWIQKLYRRKNGKPGGGSRAGRGRWPQRLPPVFEGLRWLVMILSFAGLVWGARLFGTAIHNIHLPVLACSYNLDQATEACCYFFGHLNELKEFPLTQIFWLFGSFIVCAVLFGRLLCGFVCPLGFLQDVMHQLRQALHVNGLTLTERLYAVLRFIKWIMLLLFLGLGLVGGSFCDFCPAIAVSPVLAGFKTSLFFSGYMMVFVLVGGFFKRRCFCNICPMGYLLGLPHKASLARLKKDAVACTECGACYEACPMGIKSVFTARDGKKERSIDVTTADCIFCGECVRRCPEDGALRITLAGIPLVTASRERFMKDYASPEKKGKSEEMQ